MVSKVTRAGLWILMIAGTGAGSILIGLGVALIVTLTNPQPTMPQTGFAYEANPKCTPAADASEEVTDTLSYADIPQELKGTAWADDATNVYFHEDHITIVDLASGAATALYAGDFSPGCTWHGLKEISRREYDGDVYYFIPIGDQILGIKQINESTFVVQRTIKLKSGLETYELQKFSPSPKKENPSA